MAAAGHPPWPLCLNGAADEIIELSPGADASLHAEQLQSDLLHAGGAAICDRQDANSKDGQDYPANERADPDRR